MKSVWDYTQVKLGDLTGAPRHHAYFSEDRSVANQIREAARFIGRYGVAEYIKLEYADARFNLKNIILNCIDGELFVTDGNRHCVSIVLAKPEITIGLLLAVEPKLFRYWEEGIEAGSDPKYQPYVTFVPLDVDVSRIPEAKEGIDDKGQKINVIPSNIRYDSEVFAERDRGRKIYETVSVL